MKRFFVLILTILILPINCVFSAYTLDTIYNENTRDEKSATPYILPNFGVLPCEPCEILLSSRDVYFHIGENEAPFSLDAKLMPLNSKKSTITYSSSDETIATVDAFGNITPKDKLGSAIITAKSNNLKAECRVSVITGVTSIDITYAPARLFADKSEPAKAEALVYPENAGIKDIIWESSDNSIATVSRTGTIIPCGVGTVTITALSKDKGFRDSVDISVELWDGKSPTKPVSVKYSDYDYTLAEATELQSFAQPTLFYLNATPATVDDIKEYIDPSHLTSEESLYQFLDLSVNNGISAKVLDNYLFGKGILNGTGKTFKKAADKYNVSEVYLAVHACLETANGTSELANGIEYNGERVYNMFGIGAIDEDPIGGGASYAYQNGWTTPEKAIDGGAEWISTYYINNPDYAQNTLYKMRWNPKAPGNHQYATDVAWASKQSQTLKNMFLAFPKAKLVFDYPVYKGETKKDLAINQNRK